MKNKLKLITILTLVLLLIIPVNAVTVNVDYTTGMTTGTVTAISGTVKESCDQMFYMTFPAIEEWANIKYAVYKIKYEPSYPIWVVRDTNVFTSEAPVTYKIGANIISTGEMQVNVYKNPDGSIRDAVLGFGFDTTLDLGTSSGAVTVTLDYIPANFNIYPSRPRMISPTGIRTNTHNCPYPVTDTSNALMIAREVSGEAYKFANFHQYFVYNVDEEPNPIGIYELDLNYYRNGTTNQIYINDSADFRHYNDNDNVDIERLDLIKQPIYLNVSNPQYIGSGIGEWFNFSLPPEYEDEEGEYDYADLTYTVYNAEIPTQIISTIYNLTIYNSTSEIYEPYKTGFNPGTMTLENILNDRFYNMSLTKTGFTSKDDLISVFYAGYGGPVNLVTYMYPDYGEDNYSVMFKVRDYSTGDFLQGAKVIGNGVTKYTPYNGDVGFAVLTGNITYDISKSGYVSISGDMPVTMNQAIYIYLMTEEEALSTPTITPTPTPPPDIDKPTNLLESIQFAFTKMFGLTSSTEDLETSNLFMGLGIIFAGAVLIASITKDALGAVVGALIGFVMSLALGFIPLWVLFVGFASFAIYIILTKTGGGE